MSVRSVTASLPKRSTCWNTTRDIRVSQSVCYWLIKGKRKSVTSLYMWLQHVHFHPKWPDSADFREVHQVIVCFTVSLLLWHFACRYKGLHVWAVWKDVQWEDDSGNAQAHPHRQESHVRPQWNQAETHSICYYYKTVTSRTWESVIWFYLSSVFIAIKLEWVMVRQEALNYAARIKESHSKITCLL